MIELIVSNEEPFAVHFEDSSVYDLLNEDTLPDELSLEDFFQIEIEDGATIDTLLDELGVNPVDALMALYRTEMISEEDLVDALERIE